MDSAKFNCRQCKNPKCNRMAIEGDYCTACQHIYDALEAEIREISVCSACFGKNWKADKGE